MSTRVRTGEPATFTVVASGEGLTYQWFGPDGAPLVNILGEISGATSATLRILNVQSEDLGNYYVRVFSSAGGSRRSDVVTLSLSKELKCCRYLESSLHLS